VIKTNTNMQINLFQKNGLTNNILYHFGDSYGVPTKSKHFANLFADCFNVDYINYACNGFSNELIFQKMLEKSNEFKENDIIFINFSFFNRGCYWDGTRLQVEPTNTLYNEITKEVQSEEWFNKTNELEKVIFLLEYYLKYDEDYNRRIFKLIDTFFQSILQKNIKIYYIFIDNSDYKNYLLSGGYNINFDEGFAKWLIQNNLHNEQDSHYTSNSQTIILNKILTKI
jgi:hypothetical protein